MSAEQTLHDALTAGSPDNAVVTLVTDRIYPIVVPEGEGLPAVAYQRTNTEYTNTISNTALAARVTFDVFCVAPSFKAAEDLANAVADIVEDADEITKINRTHTFDGESMTYAVIITVDVWE